MSYDVLFEAIGVAFTWPVIAYVFVGLAFGIVCGALPGIGPSVGVAIALPLSLPLDPTGAIVLLICVYSGAMYGGSIASILINTPGAAGNAATTFDGYPLSRQGRAIDALSLSAVSSSVGGFVTVLILILSVPVLIAVVLAFQSPEYFLVALLGISLITVVAQGAMLKGLLAGTFGLLLATVGIPVMSPTPRYTFGILALYDGIYFVAALIGMFAVAEMFKLAGETGGIAKGSDEVEGSRRFGFSFAKDNPFLVLKSGIIGMFVGAIPGSGATVSNFVSYAEQVRSSKNPDSYGSGNPKGVIASEAANNGTVGGSLVPTLAFGIPGSGATAVLLGGLLMHGLRPGPDLFSDQLIFTYTVFVGLLISNIFIFIVGTALITKMSILTRVNTDYLIPPIIVLSVIGVFTINANWIDVVVVFVTGVLGYYMVKHNYSVIAFVLGIVLGPIAEDNLFRSLRISGGSLDIFYTRPLSLLLLLGIVFILFGSPIASLVKRVRS